MSSARQEDGPPNIVPVPRSGIHRTLGALSFPLAPKTLHVPGGTIELSGMLLSHAGETPTTVTNTASSAELAQETISELLEKVAAASSLLALNRSDEARFELLDVIHLAEEARRWLE